MYRILIADPLHQSGIRLLEEANVEIHQLTQQERPELVHMIRDFDALIVRSMTKVDAALIASGERLRVVGRAGIGVDNVDVAAATKHGILVVNAPTANLVSAAEHTFALLLSLVRNITQADRSVKGGEWDRQKFLGTELQGKCLGIVGLGRIGRSVALRAKAFDMRIVAFDPYLDPAVAQKIDVQTMPLDELMRLADIVTLHTPLTDQTRNLVGREQIGQMKPGAFLINCGRGGLVDEAALLEGLEQGKIAGVGLDVFVEEPPQDLRLVRHSRVVATPHIGAQTKEAQERVATETARMVLSALSGSLAVTAVNLPFGDVGPPGQVYLSLAEQLGRLAGLVMGSSIQEVKVDLWGIEKGLRTPVAIAALKGALAAFLGEPISLINAEQMAEERGVELVISTHRRTRDYSHLMGVELRGESAKVTVAGALFGEKDPRVVRFEGKQLEFRPEGRLLVIRNRDVPGVVGRVGSILGDAGVNIAEIHLARNKGSGGSAAVLRLDQAPDQTVIERISTLPEIFSVQSLDLGTMGSPTERPK